MPRVIALEMPRVIALVKYGYQGISVVIKILWIISNIYNFHFKESNWWFFDISIFIETKVRTVVVERLHMANVRLRRKPDVLQIL